MAQYIQVHEKKCSPLHQQHSGLSLRHSQGRKISRTDVVVFFKIHSCRFVYVASAHVLPAQYESALPLKDTIK